MYVSSRPAMRAMSMRAVVLTQPHQFELRSDVDVPTPGPNHALLRVTLTTICGTDEKIFAGLFPGTKFPHIPGHEFSGEIVELGPGVDALTPGQRVAAEA